MKSEKNRKRLVYICEAGVIGALYTVLTLLIGPFGNAVVQCRVSEALCVLPFFTPAAIPGLTFGCLISNLFTGVWQDVIFGTLTTLIGAIGARLVRKIVWLVPLPTVLSNTVIIPHVLAYAYHATEGIPFLMFSIGMGEIVSVYVLGLPLLFILQKYQKYIFKN